MLDDSADLVLQEPFYAPSTEGALDHLFSQREAVKERIEAESSREQFPDDHARYRYYADRAEQLAREVKP